VSRITSIATEPVDVSTLARGREQYRSLIPPMNQITVLREEPVAVKLGQLNKKR
jgi:hypothetical protein